MSQITALLGHLSISSLPYGKIIGLIVFVSFLTMFTNRMTILAQLKKWINAKTASFNFMIHNVCSSYSMIQDTSKLSFKKYNLYHPWRRLFRYFPPTALILLIIVLLFCIGFIIFSEKTERLQPPNPLPKADAIIVLTGGENRIETGLNLLRKNLVHGF